MGAIYIITIGDCANQFIHIQQLWFIPFASYNLEIVDYDEDRINFLQILVWDHASDQHYFFYDVMPRESNQQESTSQSSFGRIEYFKIAKVKQSKNGVELASIIALFGNEYVGM